MALVRYKGYRDPDAPSGNDLVDRLRTGYNDFTGGHVDEVPLWGHRYIAVSQQDWDAYEQEILAHNKMLYFVSGPLSHEVVPTILFKGTPVIAHPVAPGTYLFVWYAEIE